MRNEKKYLIINSKYFGEDYLKTKIDEELESKRISLYDDASALHIRPSEQSNQTGKSRYTAMNAYLESGEYQISLMR